LIGREIQNSTKPKILLDGFLRSPEQLELFNRMVFLLALISF
jgi:hypothetical protein